MENRRPVHYKGNTLDIPEPQKKFSKKELRVKFGREKNIIHEYEKKVVMTSLCAFCGNRSDEYRSICRFCGTCQYCGLRSNQRDLCRFCGNSDIIKQKRVKKTFTA